MNTREREMNIRPNKVKQKLAAGETVYVVSGLNGPDSIDQFGPVDFDGVWLEGEHGPVDFGDIANLTRACDVWGMTSIMRVNRNDQAIIYRTLDQGVQGVVVPHVDTREEAQNVVAGGKFAPIGQRGMFGSRQSYGIPDYFQAANDHTLLVVLIEDIVAVRNLDEILEVDHIDVFFVAPSDLAASMGHIGEIGHPEVGRTIDDTLARIQQRGRVAGTLANHDNVSEYTAAGVRFFLTTVAPWLSTGAKGFISRSKEAKRSA
jgi:4-hydroxy-2-oxoheptanedioate aldolase